MSHDEATRLAQECYDLAMMRGGSTREVARDLVAKAPRAVIEFLAAEFLVAEVQRAQRSTTLEAERGSQRQAQTQAAEAPGAAAARAEARERDEWLIQQSLNANISRAIDRYTEDVKMKWTAELLDSTFALRDGSTVAWGEATIEQHVERRQMFIDNARANIEGASRHETAIRELRAAGVATLRELARAAAA